MQCRSYCDTFTQSINDSATSALRMTLHATLAKVATAIHVW